jgi:DNA-binding MarR family transcriptional regulator
MNDAIDRADPLRLDDIPDAASLVHVAVERLFRILKAQMATALEARGSSIVEWRILLMLRIHGEMPQKHLVTEVAMAQAQVSRTLAAMQRRGLVRAERSTGDRRVWLFALTGPGRDLYRRIAPTLADRKALLDACLPAAELESFLVAARTVARAAAIRIDNHESSAGTEVSPVTPAPGQGSTT